MHVGGVGGIGGVSLSHEEGKLSPLVLDLTHPTMREATPTDYSLKMNIRLRQDRFGGSLE